ncbi:cell division cycle protein 20 homolog [Scyliorhinus canicula]|uniref:cell division cycle protein 20 homolog n=1 Tax=Scyliorhinus canicula TaxID=7830 RepID=UPI0018F5A29F|nr:cell division cycle protein 20 homolog [Scyliorhinus canicula]
MKWELPSPVASSSPIVTKWQNISRRECRRAAASNGVPVVTVIEAEGRTRTGALTSAATTAKAVAATEKPARDGCGAKVEVVIMIQAEEGILKAAEGGSGGAGAENKTDSVTVAGTLTGAEPGSGPGFEEAKLNPPPNRKVDFQPACPGHCEAAEYKNNLGDAFLHDQYDDTKSKRCIPLTPMKVLDAPGLKDDYSCQTRKWLNSQALMHKLWLKYKLSPKRLEKYNLGCGYKKGSANLISDRLQIYLNLVDWNAANLVAIALSNAVHLWHPEKGVQETISVESGYISSVAWIKDRNNLAIGTSAADVQLWDVETKKKLRNMHSHSSMVGSLSWNDYILSSGSRFGTIHHHDVRIAQHHVGTLCGHNSQVCSLKWSPDGRILASGGNDGRLNIWLNDPGTSINSKPDMTINNQQSAVKAMNWCSWQSGILAVGGGMKDGHLRIWDTKSGNCIRDVDTKSQICSLLWLSQYKELVTGHGFPKYQASVWNYPSLMKSADLKGHRGRVLHLALSPDGNIVCSAAADETVCLWSCLTASEQMLDAKGI